MDAGKRPWAIAAVMMLVGVAALAPAPSPANASTPTAEQALSDLNAWRALAGENPVGALNGDLSEGCRLHNAYMAQNGGLTHSEDPARPGYNQLGAQAGGSSVLASGESGPRQAWDGAVYHRMGLLEPRLTSTWFDASSGSTCMGIFGTSQDPTARTPGVTLYPWPANGTRAVPAVFEGGESPDPAQSVPGATQLGYLLSVNVNGPWQTLDGSTLSAASLTPDGGGPVAATGVDRGSANAWALNGGVGIFPNQPLEEGVWYTAHVVGLSAGTDFDPQVGAVTTQLPFDLTWRFQTHLKDPATSMDVNQGTVTVRSSSPAPVHLTLTRAGTTVAQRDLGDGQKWATGAPAGTYQVCAHQDEAGRYAGYDHCETMTVDGHTVVSGRATLHNRLVTVIAGVSPLAQQSLTVTLARPRACPRHVPCRASWKPFKAATTTAAPRRVVHIRVGRGDRLLQVTVTVTATIIDGARYPPATAVKVIRAR